VIFGGAGDPTQRKLLPALCNLHLDGLLPPRIAVVATSRAVHRQAYRALRAGMQRFSRRPWMTPNGRRSPVSFLRHPRPQRPQAFPRLGARLDTIEHERGLPGNRVYYLAVPSNFQDHGGTARAGAFVGPPDRTPTLE
jgi:glucose-6-phosphate 1-dehydrogenase